MFKTGNLVSPIGAFEVREIKPEYIKVDPFEKGGVSATKQYKANGTIEITADGTEKEFDGYSVCDFFRFDGNYKVIDSDDLFTKVNVNNQVLSFPNHKLEVINNA